MTFKYLKGLAAGSLLLASGLAHAQFSSTVTATNDYDFRGVSQSATDPALQVSADYAFSNGFAVGAWASNVDFEPLDGDVEANLYANYTGEISENASWTTGIVYYLYPGSDDIGEYPEVFVGLNVGAVSLKQWYSNNFYDLDVGALYTEANVTLPLADKLSLLLHAGYAWGNYWEDVAGDPVVDYSFGLGYELGNFNLALKFGGQDAPGPLQVSSGVNANEPRVIFTVSTTFPWGE